MRSRVERLLPDASLELLGAIINTIADPVFVKDEEHRWVLQNDASCNFLGRCADDLLGKSEYDFFSEEEAEKFRRTDDEVLRTGRESVSEEAYTDARGQTRLIRIRKTLHTTRDGKKYIVGIHHDITEQRKNEVEIARLNAELSAHCLHAIEQAESARRESEAKLRRIVEANIVGIIFWHLDGRILEANQAFLDIVGYTQEDVRQGKVNWREMTPPELVAADDHAREELMATGIHTPFEKQYITKTGSRRDIYLYGAFMEGSREEGIGVVMDITAHKENERERELYAKRLELSNKELESFATIASHDLQAPLRKIQIFTEHVKSISQSCLSDEAVEDIGRILKSTSRMQALIDDLLTLSRVTRKGQPFQRVVLDEVFRDVIDDLRFEIRDARGRIEVDTLCTITADKTQMHQMFQNLLQNGLEFHRENVPPVIRVSAELSEPGFCLLTVKDNGVGIKAEYYERIFETFMRLHGIHHRSGTGIGLAICKKIVERHNGSIWADSVPDEGSTFHIRLPIRQEALPPPPGAE